MERPVTATEVSENVRANSTQVHPMSSQHGNDGAKQTYRSFKKKYKKMRLQFDEKMRQSNECCMQEQMAIATARRLAQENDQLLDMLHDVNGCAQIPADQRINVLSSTVNQAASNFASIPSLITADELSLASKPHDPQSQAIYAGITAALDKQAKFNASFKSLKSLAHLISTTPHTSSANPLNRLDPPSSFEPIYDSTTLFGYLTIDQIDDYLHNVDASIGLSPGPPPPPKQPLTQQDLNISNPNSVYNWLRRHEPKIFLQDGEGSERSHGKPSAVRGAGKKGMIPAPVKNDALEIVEEDGTGYHHNAGGSVKAKRKREIGDDGNYHPKTGRVDDPKPKKRSYNRKKKGGEGGTIVVARQEAEGEEAATPPKSKTVRIKTKPKPKGQAASGVKEEIPGGKMLVSGSFDAPDMKKELQGEWMPESVASAGVTAPETPHMSESMAS